MNSIPQSEGIDKLPVAELQADLDSFLQPVETLAGEPSLDNPLPL